MSEDDRTSGDAEAESPAAYADEMYIAMGRYLRMWSQQEALLKACAAWLTGMKLRTAYIVFDRTSVQQLIQTCTVLAGDGLPAEEAAAVGAWLKAVEAARVDRNAIIHGAWFERWTGTRTEQILYSTKSRAKRLTVSADPVGVSYLEACLLRVHEAGAGYASLPPGVQQQIRLLMPEEAASTAGGEDGGRSETS